MDDFRRLGSDLDILPPRELSLHVTSRCNLACRWCRRQTIGTGRKPDMTAELVREALKAIPSIRSVCIAGFGEPLLCPELEGIIATCKEARKFVGLITNGVLLAGWATRLAELKVDQVSMSLNAPNAQAHAEETGSPEGFVEAVAGVEAAVAAMPGRVALSMVCHRANVHKAWQFLTLAGDLGVTRVDLLNLLPHGYDPQSPETFWSQVLAQDDSKVAFEIARLKTHPAAGLVRTWPVLISRDSCPRRCNSPYVSLSMDSLGNFSPCRRCTPPTPELGNLTNGPMGWKTVAWYQLRAGIEGDTPLRSECRTCWGNWSG